jgi:phospholipid transport system transporter-binding protein
MSAAALNLEAVGPGQFRLSGAVTVANAGALQRAGLQTVAKSQGAITIDLGAVTPIDSAGVALLIDWLAAARAAGRELRYLKLPPAARALARLSEVERLLDPTSV